MVAVQMIQIIFRYVIFRLFRSFDVSIPLLLACVSSVPYTYFSLLLYYSQLLKTHTQVYLASLINALIIKGENVLYEHASVLTQGPLNPNRFSPDAGRLLPSALRRLGVLRLSADLAAAVDLGKPLEAGDPFFPRPALPRVAKRL